MMWWLGPRTQENNSVLDVVYSWSHWLVPSFCGWHGLLVSWLVMILIIGFVKQGLNNQLLQWSNCCLKRVWFDDMYLMSNPIISYLVYDEVMQLKMTCPRGGQGVQNGCLSSLIVTPNYWFPNFVMQSTRFPFK